MEDTRHAIRQGRILADEGLYEHAVETWKAALNGAYTLQDYAGMFVLSGNIGEACVRIATESQEKSPMVLKLLQEAVENLDYALRIVEQCSLREVLGGYRSLYQGVRRAEMLRRKAQKMINKLQSVEKEIEAKKSCTTCGGTGEEVVLDENDGCYYCKKCYDDYYAVEGVAMATEDLASEEKAVGVDDIASDHCRAVHLDNQDDGSTADDAKPTSELVEVIEVAPGSKDRQIEEVIQETSEEIVGEDVQGNAAEKATQDRVRYERVELGSLADFLAGKLYSGNEAQQPETSIIAGVISTKEPTDVSAEDRNGETVDPAALLESAALEENELGLSEADDTTDACALPDKLVYSIALLRELRKSSPCDCPEPLLDSPVRDDGTAPTPARNKPSNSRKKSNAKKNTRPVASHKPSNADAADTNQVAAPEIPSISPLPTLELCDAMRKALHEHQEQHVGSSSTCDNLVAAGTTTQALAALLSN